MLYLKYLYLTQISQTSFGSTNFTIV